MRAIERGGLLVKDIEILTYHYADTLKLWRERFHANRDQVLELYDERFFRMWDLYLATPEASFRYGKLFNFQIQIVKKQSTARPTRDYISAVESTCVHTKHRNFVSQFFLCEANGRTITTKKPRQLCSRALERKVVFLNTLEKSKTPDLIFHYCADLVKVQSLPICLLLPYNELTGKADHHWTQCDRLSLGST